MSCVCANLAEVRCLGVSKLVGFTGGDLSHMLGNHLNVIWDEGQMAIIIK